MTDRAFGTYQMKPGQGIHTFRKRGIVRDLRPGDSIDCYPGELGGALYKFKCIQPPGPKEQPTVGLKLVHRGGQWYDVVNEATGKPINDKALRKEDAEQLVADETASKAQLECAGCGASISEGDPRCKDEPTCKDCADELEEARAKGVDEE